MLPAFITLTQEISCERECLNKIVTLAGKRSFVPNFDGPEILGPKNFPMLDGGGLFHTFCNFWFWTQKWKIYIDIFYRVSCNIKHITAIWNLYFQ